MRLRRSARWVTASSPAPAPELDRTVVEIEGAVLTRYRQGMLRATHGPARWMSGAVHDRAGRLVDASQRLWTGDPLAPAAADPQQVEVPRRAKVLDGRWLYAGHWHGHFGHFFLETLTTLWPDPTTVDVVGLVGHRHYWGPSPAVSGGPGVTRPTLNRWQAELLDLAGYGGLDVRVVRNRAARVERLLVPRRSVVLKSWAARPAVDVWRRIAGTVTPATEDRVFFSRRLYHLDKAGNEQRVRVERQWDTMLERAFADAGFLVVHPERLAIREQLALVRGATVLAGSSGSALHLSAFASPGTQVLEVGDSRSEREPMPTQRMVDAACGHRSAFVPYRARRELERRLAAI